MVPASHRCRDEDGRPTRVEAAPPVVGVPLLLSRVCQGRIKHQGKCGVLRRPLAMGSGLRHRGESHSTYIRRLEP